MMFHALKTTLFAVTTLLFAMLGQAWAEGSKQLWDEEILAWALVPPPADSPLVTKARQFAFAREGETIELRSTAVGVGTGRIRFWSPLGQQGECSTLGFSDDAAVYRNIDGADVVATRDDSPCVIQVSRQNAGIWEVAFDAPNQIGTSQELARALSDAPFRGGLEQRPGDAFVAAFDVTVSGLRGNAGGRLFTRVPSFAANQDLGPGQFKTFVRLASGTQMIATIQGADLGGQPLLLNGLPSSQMPQAAPQMQGDWAAVAASLGNNDQPKFFYTMSDASLPPVAVSLYGERRRDWLRTPPTSAIEPMDITLLPKDTNQLELFISPFVTPKTAPIQYMALSLDNNFTVFDEGAFDAKQGVEALIDVGAKGVSLSLLDGVRVALSRVEDDVVFVLPAMSANAARAQLIPVGVLPPTRSDVVSLLALDDAQEPIAFVFDPLVGFESALFGDGMPKALRYQSLLSQDVDLDTLPQAGGSGRSDGNDAGNENAQIAMGDETSELETTNTILPSDLGLFVGAATLGDDASSRTIVQADDVLAMTPAPLSPAPLLPLVAVQDQLGIAISRAAASPARRLDQNLFGMQWRYVIDNSGQAPLDQLKVYEALAEPGTLQSARLLSLSALRTGGEVETIDQSRLDGAQLFATDGLLLRPSIWRGGALAPGDSVQMLVDVIYNAQGMHQGLTSTASVSAIASLDKNAPTDSQSLDARTIAAMDHAMPAVLAPSLDLAGSARLVDLRSTDQGLEYRIELFVGNLGDLDVVDLSVLLAFKGQTWPTEIVKGQETQVLVSPQGAMDSSLVLDSTASSSPFVLRGSMKSGDAGVYVMTLRVPHGQAIPANLGLSMFGRADANGDGVADHRGGVLGASSVLDSHQISLFANEAFEPFLKNQVQTLRANEFEAELPMATTTWQGGVWNNGSADYVVTIENTGARSLDALALSDTVGPASRGQGRVMLSENQAGRWVPLMAVDQNTWRAGRPLPLLYADGSALVLEAGSAVQIRAQLEFVPADALVTGAITGGIDLTVNGQSRVALADFVPSGNRQPSSFDPALDTDARTGNGTSTSTDIAIAEAAAPVDDGLLSVPTPLAPLPLSGDQAQIAMASQGTDGQEPAIAAPAPTLEPVVPLVQLVTEQPPEPQQLAEPAEPFQPVEVEEETNVQPSQENVEANETPETNAASTAVQPEPIDVNDVIDVDLMIPSARFTYADQIAIAWEALAQATAPEQTQATAQSDSDDSDDEPGATTASGFAFVATGPGSYAWVPLAQIPQSRRGEVLARAPAPDDAVAMDVLRVLGKRIASSVGSQAQTVAPSQTQTQTQTALPSAANVQVRPSASSNSQLTQIPAGSRMLSAREVVAMRLQVPAGFAVFVQPSGTLFLVPVQ